MNPASVTPPAFSFPRRGKSLVARVARLALKELRETLRDRRTIITLLLMPVIVYPLLSLGFQRFLVSGVGGTAQESYRVGVGSHEDGELLGKMLKKGFEVRSRRDRRNADAQAKDVREDSKPAEPARFPIEVFVEPDLEDAITSNTIDVGVRIRRKEAFRLTELLEQGFDCELLDNEASYRSREANAFVEQLLSAVNSDLYRIQLRNLNISGRITAVRIERTPVEIAGIPASKAHSLATLIPLILILMTITGAVYPAIDLTAGERERGTLEILIAAPVPRLQLLLAKYAAVVAVALLTATVNLVSMIVTVMSMGLGPLLFGGSGVSILLVLQIFGLLLLFAAFFSAVLLAVTSFARSFKEAQAYLIPLMLVSIAPGLLSMMPGLRLNGPLAVAPLLNIVLLARDLFEGDATPLLVVIVVCSTLLFALASISLAARIFGTDAILYGAQGTWSDLIRRPAQPTSVPTMASALLCLALMFPANFLLGNFVARTETENLGLKLWMISVVTILLFGLFPLGVAMLNRVRITDGFRMQPAAALAFVAAAMLGISLWAFAHEVVVLQGLIGLISLSPEQINAARALIERFRAELSPAQVVLALAVVPAVCEELFFRGYLLNAMGTRVTSGKAILLSGVLFGLFHVLVTDRLAIERFLPTTLLGFALGWVCIRTGSLWPGMLLHALHNGLLMLASYYQQELAAWGLGLDQQADLENSHLPVTWLAAALVVAAIGFGVMIVATREQHANLSAYRPVA